MKILDYEGLKQVVSKIKGLIDKKADKAEFTRLSESFKFIDTRDTNESPIYYIKNKPKQLVKEFKNLKSIGVNSSSDYCLLITMYPWQDSSAGYPVQIVSILKSDEVYIRRGISDTAWGRWRRILDDTDLKTKLSQLSQDSTHRLVTDAEKTKWNNKAEKTDLNSYIKKDGDKVLTDNNFSYDLKSKLDRISNKSDAELLNTIWDISYSDRIFNDENLYQKLNSYAGTNLSSSIRTVDQLIASSTGWANFINTTKAVDAIYNCSSALEKVFMNSDATNKLLDNETNYEKLLNSSNALMMAFNSDLATEKLISKSDFSDKLVNNRAMVEAMIYSLQASEIILSDQTLVNKIIDSAIAMNAMVDTSQGMKLIFSMPVLWDAIRDNSQSIDKGTVTGKLIIISVGTGTTKLYLPTGRSTTGAEEGMSATAFKTYVTKIYMDGKYSGRTSYFKVKEL